MIYTGTLWNYLPGVTTTVAKSKLNLVGIYLPDDMLEHLDDLCAKRAGVARTVLAREGLKLLFEREDLRELEEDLQRKAKRARIEASAV
jgi:metal-responsive CopG/Arc/MetJ family transcriptional regulator